jgi:hypothetical protein
MSRPPQFGDIVGNDISPGEQERLGSYDMLLAARPRRSPGAGQAPHLRSRLVELRYRLERASWSLPRS